LSKWLAAIVAAAISAWACGAVAQHGTPIDDALPVIAVIVTAIAALTFPAIELAVPLLIGGEIVIADERLRLLWFGLVLGIAFGAALFGIRDSGFAIQTAAESRIPNPESRSIAITIGAIVLLRWIPLRNVLVLRELVLLAIAIAIVAALRWRATGVAIAVAAAVFTPAFPLRTLGFPIAVLIAAAILRQVGMPRLRGDVLASFAICVMLLFFAWSGVFARALPLALTGLPQKTARTPIRMALAPGQSITLDVPPNAHALVVSGANIARVRRGTMAGTIGATVVRVGDIADWGFLRREHFYASRNTLPPSPAGELRDYGQSAWVDGAARVAIPRNARTLRVSAAANLPSNARLQIESFELVSR